MKPDAVPDPRLSHPFPSVWERSYIAGLRGAIDVPVLALETPASAIPKDERGARLRDFAGDARLLEIPDASGAAVKEALVGALLLQP